MTKHRNATKKAKNTLDSPSQKRARGRPPKIRATEVKGRADNYRGILGTVWASLWPSLSEVQSVEDVNVALQNARPYDREFVPWASLIFELLKDSRFPKRPRARINFLADSLAGLGIVSPRRSRDICTRERARAKRTHHILRYEFYVECSCGYKGHSENHACQKCGAGISFPLGLANLF